MSRMRTAHKKMVGVKSEFAMKTYVHLRTTGTCAQEVNRIRCQRHTEKGLSALFFNNIRANIHPITMRYRSIS